MLLLLECGSLMTNLFLHCRKAIGLGPRSHLACKALHFSTSPAVTPDYKFNNIIMRYLTLNFLAAERYQFEVLIKSFCGGALSSVQSAITEALCGKLGGKNHGT